jgi:formylmethanofuran dehydrogenase subunit C
MLGQRVATLISGEYYEAGMYNVHWNARDDIGHEVSSGLYIYRISAGDYVNMKKMMFTK